MRSAARLALIGVPARALEKNPLEHGAWNEIALAYADRGVGIRNHFWLQ